MELVDQCLYVGSSDGRIFMYSLQSISDHELQGTSRVNDPKSEGKSLGFGKKASVDCLISHPDQGRLLVLCHENVTVHKLKDLELLSAPKALKGSSLMCAGKIDGKLYVATINKKKLELMVWEMDQNSKDGVTPAPAFARPLDVKRLTDRCSGTPMRMSMCGSSICIGYEKGYVMFQNVVAGPVGEQNLDHLPPVVAPYLMTMNDTDMLVSCEEMGMILEAGNGMPAPGKPPLMIGEGVPMAFARSPPYVVALFPTHIDVFNVDKGQKVQVSETRSPAARMGG